MQTFSKTIITMCSFVVVVFSAGCKVRPAVEKSIHDTTIVTRTIIERDTILIAPAASVKVKVPVPCPTFKESFNGVQKQFKQVGLEMHIEGDSLSVQCDCDSLEIKAKLRSEFEKQYHSTSDKTTVKVTEKHVPHWIVVLASIGALSLILLLVFIIQKIKGQYGKGTLTI
jgi:hypothetical protein